MQNAGLPEHGDAVLTFPPHVLADPAAYARAASLTSGDTGQGDTGHGTGGHGDEALAAAARRRASLAVEGYLALRDQVADRGPAALDDFYAAALRLTAVLAADWRDRWHAGALAVAELTGGHLTEIGAQVAGHLGAAGLWRIDPSDGPRAYGMCGRLTTYPAWRAAQVG
jgi:hypothetical protein